ncbi:hypothetical protein Vafri_15819 [Volvox africanus]|uniref:Uncharacterized protein n=1 Tax=Volvox africanus TaxID=51714 RepID=A0A8J4BM07_9CHLO|nr:hypothetical protein Vafri_15819 [Volvox africanus]
MGHASWIEVQIYTMRGTIRFNEIADTLHTTTASQTANSWLGNALDVIAKYLAVALGTALAQALTALAASGHCCERVSNRAAPPRGFPTAPNPEATRSLEEGYGA